MTRRKTAACPGCQLDPMLLGEIRGKLDLIHDGQKSQGAKLDALEKKYDAQFRVVFDAIRQLMEPPPEAKRKPIGFTTEAEG